MTADMTLSPAQVQLALEYYGAFPDEVDAQIEENERAASESLDEWRVRQRLLARLLLVVPNRFPRGTGRRAATIVKALSEWLAAVDVTERPDEDWLV